MFVSYSTAAASAKKIRPLRASLRFTFEVLLPTIWGGRNLGRIFICNTTDSRRQSFEKVNGLFAAGQLRNRQHFVSFESNSSRSKKEVYASMPII